MRVVQVPAPKGLPAWGSPGRTITFHDSSSPPMAGWVCDCMIPTFCDFKMLGLWEPKMRTFCACRILEFDDLMIQ